MSVIQARAHLVSGSFRGRIGPRLKRKFTGMKHPPSLRDRVTTTLVRTPSILDMEHFSMRTDQGTTLCLAGLILNESGVHMTYDPKLGKANGLAKGTLLPAPEWIRYELSITSIAERQIEAQDVLIPAKARELWAAEHGLDWGMSLPLYAADWGNGVTYDQITARRVVHYLRWQAKRDIKKAMTTESLRDVA